MDKRLYAILERIATASERIATAFEEQNRQNAEWFRLQQQWHEEAETTGQQLLAIHEQNAQRAQEWRSSESDRLADLVVRECRALLRP